MQTSAASSSIAIAWKTLKSAAMRFAVADEATMMMTARADAASAESVATTVTTSVADSRETARVAEISEANALKRETSVADSRETVAVVVISEESVVASLASTPTSMMRIKNYASNYTRP